MNQSVFMCVLGCLTVHHWPLHRGISYCFYLDLMVRERSIDPLTLLCRAAVLGVQSSCQPVNERQPLRARWAVAKWLDRMTTLCFDSVKHPFAPYNPCQSEFGPRDLSSGLHSCCLSFYCCSETGHCSNARLGCSSAINTGLTHTRLKRKAK